MKKFLFFWLDLYHNFFAYFFPVECRFYPTCSMYTKEAILKKGIFKGILSGLFRIFRCHPLNPGGYDPLEKEG